MPFLPRPQSVGSPRSHLRRWLRTTLIAGGALGIAVAAPSSAAPGGGTSNVAGGSNGISRVTASAVSRPDLNPGGGFPAAPPGTGSGGIAGGSEGVVDQRAKQYVTTSPGAQMYFLAYLFLPNTPPSAPTSFQQIYLPDPFHQPACGMASSNPADKVQSIYERNYLYAAWPPKGGAVPGDFPPLQVKTVAFGTIPVTATLQLHQHVVDGKLRPLLNQMWAPNTTAPPRCDPAFAAPVTTLVTGQVDISLVNLKVDGVPVDVGSSCRTATPVDLALWGGDGYIPADGGTLAQYDGLHAGSLGKLDSPYYMEQNGAAIPASKGLDIPAFTGCRGRSGDDVSRLVTAMASGPDNPVSAEQSPVAFYVADVDDLTRCSLDGTNRCPVVKHNPPAMPPH